MEPVIRVATMVDEAAVLACVERLADTSVYTRASAVNVPHVTAVVRRLLENPEAGVLVAETGDGAVVGLLILLIYEHLISGDRIAAEVCWYVDRHWRRGVGVALEVAARAWAVDRQALALQMVAPAKKFTGFYERHGYQPIEQVYERSLTCRQS